VITYLLLVLKQGGDKDETCNYDYRDVYADVYAANSGIKLRSISTSSEGLGYNYRNV